MPKLTDEDLRSIVKATYNCQQTMGTLLTALHNATSKRYVHTSISKVLKQLTPVQEMIFKLDNLVEREIKAVRKRV